MKSVSKFVTMLVVICAAISPAVMAQQQSANASASAPVVGSVNKPETAPAASAVTGNYVIGADDLLAISVWKEPDLNRTLLVRSDGKISLPLVGELAASGRTPKDLETEIRQRLKAYVSDPEVTVIVQEARQTFNVLGEIFRPGAYRLTKPTTVVDAIALAGGFRDFAKRKSIYVLRTRADGSQTRIPFNYNDVIRGRNPQTNILLQASDVIVIP